MAIQKVMLMSPLIPGMLMVIIMLMMAILSRRCEDEYVKMLMLMVIIMLMMAILRKVYDDLFPSVAALPGVARLVHHLAKHQVRNSNFIHHIPSPLSGPVADVYTRVSKLISYTWIAMQGLSIALQNIRSLTSIHEFNSVHWLQTGCKTYI